MQWTYKELRIIGKFAILKPPVHPIWDFKDGNYSCTDIGSELVGKKVIIDYSYNQMFGDRSKIEDSSDSYSVIILETNSTRAWFRESQLQIIPYVQSRSYSSQSKHPWPEDHNYAGYISTHESRRT